MSLWGENLGAPSSFWRLLGRQQCLGNPLASATASRSLQALPTFFLCGSLSPGSSMGGQ